MPDTFMKTRRTLINFLYGKPNHQATRAQMLAAAGINDAALTEHLGGGFFATVSKAPKNDKGASIYALTPLGLSTGKMFARH